MALRGGSGTVAVSSITAGETHLGEVGGNSIPVRVEKTRPNETNVYAANDAINESASAGTNWTFAVGRVATGSGVITAAHIATDQTTNVSVYDLDLYDDTVTAINDNAEATSLYSNQGKYIGTITWAAVAKKTANSTKAEASLTTVNLPFKCVGSSSIYGILRTVTGFTPAANQKFEIVLDVLRD